MFKLIKRANQYEQYKHHNQHQPAVVIPSVNNNNSGRRNSTAKTASTVVSSVTFFGQELDSLLYVSMEDPDGRVREEARKALKCLGHYGQQRLNQMERSRMGFVGTITSCGRNINSDGIANIGSSCMMLGRSMPNLNKIR